MAMAKATAAYAARASSLFTIVCYGDSVTEGQGSTAPSTSNHRWIDIMRLSLQSRNLGGITGGLGAIPTSFGAASVVPWTYGGSNTPVQSRWPGGRGTNFSAAATASATLPAGSSLDVYFWQGTGTSAFTVSINGSVTTVTPAGGTLNNIGKQNITSGMLTGSTNAVILTANGAATSYIDAVVHHNGDESAGTVVFDAGRFGWRADQCSGDIDSNNDANHYLNRMPQLGAALYIIEFGLNDYQAQTAIVTFTAAVNDIITKAKSWHGYTPSFLLISPYTRTDVVAPTIPLTSYRDALSGIAAGDATNVSFLDMKPPWDAGGAGLLGGDGVHPTDAGHSFFGTTVANTILGVVAPTTNSIRVLERRRRS